MEPWEITERREGYDMSKRQFARFLGRSWSAIHKWETGETAAPAWLADWLDYIDVEVFSGRTVPKAPRHRRDVEALIYPERAKAAAEAQNARASRAKARKALMEQTRLRRDLRTIKALQKAEMERRRSQSRDK